MIMILKIIYADSSMKVIYFNIWYKCSDIHDFSAKSLFINKEDVKEDGSNFEEPIVWKFLLQRKLHLLPKKCVHIQGY